MKADSARRIIRFPSSIDDTIKSILPLFTHIARSTSQHVIRQTFLWFPPIFQENMK